MQNHFSCPYEPLKYENLCATCKTKNIHGVEEVRLPLSPTFKPLAINYNIITEQDSGSFIVESLVKTP